MLVSMMGAVRRPYCIAYDSPTHPGHAVPLAADMTLAQRGIWLVFVLLPSLLLLLPTSKAVLVWAGAFCQQALLQTWADKLSLGHISLGPLGQVLPPVLSGCLAGEGCSRRLQTGHCTWQHGVFEKADCARHLWKC